MVDEDVDQGRATEVSSGMPGQGPALVTKVKNASSELLQLEHGCKLEERLLVEGILESEHLHKFPRSLMHLSKKTSVLDKVKAFLPVLSDANQKLHSDIKRIGPNEFDIERITGGEDAQHIKMDLALGVADLYTDGAVAAAQRIMDCHSLSELDSDSSSKNEDTEDGCNKCNSDDNNAHHYEQKRQLHVMEKEKRCKKRCGKIELL